MTSIRDSQGRRPRAIALALTAIMLATVIVAVTPTAEACKPWGGLPAALVSATMRCQGTGTVTGRVVSTQGVAYLLITFTGGVTAALNPDEGFAGSFAPTRAIALRTSVPSSDVYFAFRQTQALVGHDISGVAVGAATMRPLQTPAGDASLVTMSLVIPPNTLVINGIRMSLTFTCLVTGATAAGSFTGNYVLFS